MFWNIDVAVMPVLHGYTEGVLIPVWHGYTKASLAWKVALNFMLALNSLTALLKKYKYVAIPVLHWGSNVFSTKWHMNVHLHFELQNINLLLQHEYYAIIQSTLPSEGLSWNIKQTSNAKAIRLSIVPCSLLCRHMYFMIDFISYLCGLLPYATYWIACVYTRVPRLSCSFPNVRVWFDSILQEELTLFYNYITVR